jgi:REP element-mobilizing transposase RayT
MSIRKVSLVEGEYYHIYNRGNNKQIIFIDDEDRDRFVKLLYLCNSTKSVNFRENIVEARIDAWDFDRGDQLVAIGAWVLMPNHFHLYLISSPKQGFGETDLEKNNITEFMSKLCTAYAKYFNKKHGRTGSLFEGKFKSVHVEDEIQAKYLFSYIHLNPVKLIQSDWKEVGIKNKIEAINFINEYKWNSYKDYILQNRKESSILNKEIFPDYFKDPIVFKKEIFEWLKIDSI